MMQTTFILWISPGPVPPPEQGNRGRFAYFEPWIETDVLQPCWGDRQSAPPSRFNQRNVRYHFTYSSHLPEPIRLVWDLVFFVWRGLAVFRSGRRYRAIITYGTTTTAAAGLLLKWLTRTKLLVNVPGDPRASYLGDSAQPSAVDRLKHRVSHLWIGFLLTHVDRLNLLFPGQMDTFAAAARVPQSVYAEFVNVGAIQASTIDEQYVLFLGFPWHLKGVDVLIRAFNEVRAEFPGYRLKVVGHCPDRRPFEALRRNIDRIELHKGVKHSEALELIGKCTCVVLPSRTEAMGRVLLEAMAARKPVIASRVGGIPHYITDGETGLLFESENVDDLAQCLRRVLGDAELRDRLAERGFRHAHKDLDERAYARNFTESVLQTLR